MSNLITAAGGDVVIRRDLTLVSWAGGPTWQTFDEANPPSVTPGTLVTLFPRFTNQGTVTRAITAQAMVTDPQGHVFAPTWWVDPAIPQELGPGKDSGWASAFSFTAEVPGNYTMHFLLFADGSLSDEWIAVVCRVANGVPDPAFRDLDVTFAKL